MIQIIQKYPVKLKQNDARKFFHEARKHMDISGNEISSAAQQRQRAIERPKRGSSGAPPERSTAKTRNLIKDLQRRNLELELQLRQLQTPLADSSKGSQLSFESRASSLNLVGSEPFTRAHENVTRYKLAEQTLRESEARYRHLFESSADAIFVVSQELNICSANPAAAEIYNRSVEELCGMRMIDLCLRGIDSAVADIIQQFRRGDRRSFEDYHRRKDGTSFPVEITVTNMDVGYHSYFLLLIREITVRKEAERRLRFAQFSLDHSSDGIFWVLPDGTIFEANLAVCRNLGYTHNELVGKSIQLIDPNSSAETRLANWQELKRTGSIRFEALHHTKTGAARRVEVTANYLLFDGREYNCAIVRDITARKATEELLKRNEQHAAIGQMAARVAHEINNPLSGIGNSFLLIKDAVPKEHPYFDYVRRIEEEIARIAKIVRQMLDLYSPERERLTEVTLSGVLQDVASLLERNARSMDVRIEICDFDHPITLALQDGWLRQIMFNLIQNAVEASAPGGEVRVRAQRSADCVCIIVEDDGAGIDSSVLPNIFEPFFTTKRDPHRSGVGLGLSVSQNLAIAMGGKIEIETGLDRGSRFRLILPYRLA